MGCTGKKNPRQGEDLSSGPTSIIRIILNTYDYVKEYIDLDALGGKEHIGYIIIIDRTGFEEWKKWALRMLRFRKKQSCATVYTGMA